MKKNKIFALALVLIIALVAFNSENVNAKSKWYCYNNYKHKKKTCYYGDKNRGKVTSNYTSMKTTWYTNKSLKNNKRKKYQIIKRNKSKNRTYKEIRWYRSGGKKVSQKKIWSSYGKVSGKWNYKSYRLMRYDSNKKMYYDYETKRRANGKMATKIIYQNKIKKKYSYDINGVHQKTYEWKTGKWVLIWSKPVPAPEQPSEPGNNEGLPDGWYWKDGQACHMIGDNEYCLIV